MTFGDSVKDEGDNVDNGNIFITNAIKSSKNINEGKKDNDEVEKEIKKLNDPQPISFLKLYRYATLKDKIMIAIGCFGALVTGLLSPANTLIFGRLTDAMVKQASTLFNPALTEIKYAATLINENNITSRSDAIINTDEMKDWFLNEVKMFAIYNSIIGALMFIFTYLSITLFNYAAHNQIFNIRSAFLKSALSQDMGWYDLTQSGEFSSRMNEDLSKLEEGLGEKIAMFLHFMVGFVGSMVLAFALGWQLALVCLASLPVTMISLGLVGMITSKLAKKESEAYAKAGTIAEEVFSAIRTVFAFSGQEKESKRYCENLVDAKKINIRKGFFSGFGFGLLWFFIYAAYALAFWYGIGLVLDQRGWSDDDRIYSPGVMFTVFFSVMVGSMNLGIASPFIEIFGVAKGAGAKVYSVIEQKPKIDTITDEGLIPDTAASDITFQNVNFEYPSRPEVKVLQELNFTINRGDTVALVGSSGCGKSTTIQLIQRFYDTTGGLVKLGGIDIKTMNVNWLRSRIGVVGQEPVLFGTTISENIRYGNEKATKEEIESAAKAANAHNFIKKLPNGYETLVGERGAQMSGGQKQRIAIARALVRNPEILLLDEATSALDTASEAKVQAALEKASEGRTTVIVAHRLTTIRNADKIFVFHNGKIIEQGNHKELMLLGKHYHGLVTTQVGSMEERDKPTVEKQISIRPVIDEDEKEFAVAKEEADEDLLNAPKTMSVYKIMEWNKTEWPFILLGSITSVVMGSAMPLFSLLFGKILNVLAFDDADDVRAEANIYSLYFVITGIVVGIATFLQIYTYGIAGEILTERVRGMTFSTMLKQEIGWFDDKSNGTGTLCARLSGEAAAVQGATGQRIGTVLQSISTLGLSIGLAFYYEWRLAFVALAFTPFLLIASYLEIRVMEQENLGNAKAMEKSTKLAVEVISNIRTVISLGREKMFHRKYMDLLEPSVKRAKKTTHYRGIVYGIARSLMYFVYSICMLYGGYLVVNDNVQYGDVFIVTQALIMGSVSIANAIAFAPNFHKGLLAASKINQILTRTPKIRDPQNIDQPDRKWDAYGNVIYYETDFYYPSRPSALVLNCLNMNIMQGQTVALVGSSGCGKSTCIQLLERFYDTTSGYVAIDNKDVESVTLKNLRSQLGIVSQEPSLFDRTIAENIAYGDNSREVSSDEIILAAKNANIHTFITSLPLGYETRLGDKGTQLSGGQKQRVAIARALVRNPRILLLDEATSALDSESEKIVQDALDLAKEGRTCITIAHRLTTIIDSDVIIVIDGGKSVESGTHKELMALRGIYYGLFTLQSGSL